MIYRFIIVSDETDNFRRDITIDSEASFFDLHEAILNSVGYAKDQITSFHLCDDEWVKNTEITLVDMGSGADEDIYVMENVRLSEFLDEERQRLIYVFEPLTERCFFMELREITTGDQAHAKVVKAVGQPPQQVTQFDDYDVKATTGTTAAATDDEDYFDEFGDDGFDDEDLNDLNEGNPFDY
ncbi:MAG: hypothetical protein LBR66_06510 [Candidatus Symbiothrix sp.]|jgi:hypothetical protein|nr:hypothetical protein [Candidatus Symbiothrix sp.]